MRLLIDASPISLSKGKGFRRHVWGLLHALKATQEEHQCCVLTRDPGRSVARGVEGDPRFRFRHPRRYLPLLHSRRAGFLGKIFLTGFDLIHFPCSDIWYSDRGKKSIVTIHDLTPLHRPQEFFHDSREESVYRSHLQEIAIRATAILTVSDSTRRDVMTHLKVSEKKVVALHNAIDPMFLNSSHPFSKQELLHLGLKAPYFLFVGAIDFRKNIPLLLKAFSIYRQQGGASQLVVAGKETLRGRTSAPKLQDILNQMREKDSVLWLQDVEDQSLLKLYRGARAFVFPSSLEGFGYPLVEAMASEIPIVTTKDPCLSEIAGDGALLTDLQEEAFSSAMARIDQDETLREDLKKRGRERLKMFLPKLYSQKLIRLYQSILNGN